MPSFRTSYRGMRLGSLMVAPFLLVLAYKAGKWQEPGACQYLAHSNLQF